MSETASLAARRERLAERGGGSLRTLTASGVMINAAWNIGLQGLAMLRSFIVAAFLAPEDYGVWAIIVIGYVGLGVLKQVGIVDKYIQQNDPDEETAFQKAFTLEAILTGGFWIVLMLATPLLALVYNSPAIIAPGLVALTAMPASVLQTPIWTYQRDMDFKRQRRLGAVDPVVGAVVTIVAAIAGLGYWAFALGNTAGAWTGALTIARRSPYKLRFRYDRGTARQYVRFSTPILVSNLSSLVLLQGMTLVTRWTVGVAGVGAMSLADSIRVYTAFADSIISSTMYPAVCAVRDRTDLMYESFIKSNRLALMWGFPVGLGVTLFADDLVHFVLGDQWHYAVVVFEAVGIASAVGHIAFNWDDYIRARGDTRPMATSAWIGLLGWAIGPVPLIIVDGLHGYAIGLFIVTGINLLVRGYYLRRMFPNFSLVPHGLRAMAPTLVATGLLLAVRAAESASGTLLSAIAELGVYLGIVVIVTWLAERALLGEAVGYLRRARGLT